MDEILLLDIGNTRLRWALDAGGSFIGGGQMVHGGDPQALRLDELPLPATAAGRIVASCVAGQAIRDAVADWAAAHQQVCEWIVSPAAGHGVVNAYAEPHRLGSDRWAALVAVQRLAPGPACIVDAGTAITVDLLAAGGRHLGGYILPGWHGLVDSVLAQTALAAEPLPEPDRSPGRDTRTGLANGALTAVCALVESAVERLETELQESVQCVLTGGDSGLLGRHLSIPHATEPALVLRGLAIIAREDVVPS